jgi:hypothetical protein
MAIETSIGVIGGEKPYFLIIEPWADEYTIQPNDHCQIIFLHPTAMTPVVIKWHEDALIISANIGDATFQFWRNGNLEDSSPIPIPGPLGEFERWKKQ